MNNLKGIVEDIATSLKFPMALQNERYLIHQLKHLDPFERKLIRKKFLNHEWNVGSVRLFGILQPLHLASITDYLLQLTETNKIFFVLNDLLESDFALISEIIADENSTLQESLSLCYRSFISDAINNSESIKINFLEHISNYLTYFQLKRVHYNILDTILKSQEDDMLGIVLQQQKIWITSLNDDQLIVKIIKLLVLDSPQSLLEHLMAKASSSNFNGWFYFLQILRIILKSDLLEDNLIGFLKDFQRKNWTNFLKNSSERQFLILILIARQLSYVASEHFGDYCKWYKATIGEMAYAKIEKSEFITVLQFLTKLTELESDLEILEIHSKTAIHALPFTNSVVLEFKQITRNQIEYINDQKRASKTEANRKIEDSFKSLTVDLTLKEDEEMVEL